MTHRFIAFLRGINVGHAKRIAMADLRSVFERLGFRDVRTVLNSGNVVFTASVSRVDGPAVEQAIAASLGVSTRVTVVRGNALASAIEANPLAPIATDPARMLIMVLQDTATGAQLQPLVSQRWHPEALAVGSVVRGATPQHPVAYLWCANGINGGELVTAVNRIVGDRGTARNLTTMKKLLALL